MWEASQQIEREKWTRGVSIKIPTATMEHEINVHVRRAVMREREACLHIAETTAAGRDAEAIADAIRARGNKRESV